MRQRLLHILTSEYYLANLLTLSTYIWLRHAYRYAYHAHSIISIILPEWKCGLPCHIATSLALSNAAMPCMVPCMVPCWSMLSHTGSLTHASFPLRSDVSIRFDAVSISNALSTDAPAKDPLRTWEYKFAATLLATAAWRVRNASSSLDSALFTLLGYAQVPAPTS